MRRILLLFLICLSGFQLAQAQSKLNLDSIAHLTYPAGVSLNDIWGYVDGQGNEYALVGKTNGLSVVSLADTSNLVEVFSEMSVFSIWRDIKTWGDYAYVTNESSGGLAIYDLSTLPDSVKSVSYYTGNNFAVNSAHNIFIDENGVAYLFGSNHTSGSFGTIMLDVATTPGQPIELGYYDSLYFHDGYARGDTLYGSAVYNGLLVVLDVSNKSNPKLLGTKTTPSNFTHNAWASDNSQYIFTTDEVSGGYVAAYDVSNLNNIVQVDRMRSRNTTNVIPHNTHVLNDFLITSYYTLGVSIVDANKPDNLIEVGYFDTSPAYTGGGFNGNWGAYPYLPSGNLILSDIENGLFLLRPRYGRASYLEGNVKDCNGNAITQANVKIVASSSEEKTNLLGDFKTGTHLNGYLSVEVSKQGFQTRIYDSVLFVAGQVTNVNFELLGNGDGLRIYTLDNAGNAISNAPVALSSNTISATISTSASGLAFYQNLPLGEYQIKAGKWAYSSACQDNYQFTCATKNDTIRLTQGYADDFSSDLNWTVSGVGNTWVREQPIGTTHLGLPANPSSDFDGLCGGFAYVTGNTGGSAMSDDVDGFTTLASPATDLTNMLDPYIQFRTWFENRGANENDYLLVRFENKTGGLVNVDTIRKSSTSGFWNQNSYRISDYMNKSDFNKVIFTAIDNAPDDLVEAGIDDLTFTEGAGISIVETKGDAEVQLAPNPTKDNFRITFAGNQYLNGQLSLYDIKLQKVIELPIQSQQIEINFEADAPAGIYFLRITSPAGKVLSKKIVKL